MNHLKSFLLVSSLLSSVSLSAQAPTEIPQIEKCGSHHLIQHKEAQHPGYAVMADQMMTNLKSVLESSVHAKDQSTIYTLPLVFHVVYNNATENIHDSLIHNQIEVLNNCFRRMNADTVNTRSEFQDLVGDVKIQFKLATVDPLGNPTTGITRTQTSIAHFMGDMASSSFMTDFYSNIFRITDDQNGGKAAWNTDEYINVWVGDLSAYANSPGNGVQEVLLGMATPPLSHTSFANLPGMSDLEEDGVIMHFKTIGANNTIPFNTSSANNTNKSGKAMVHELGHYLGLRHIWGDGDCMADDYIDDTPLASSASSGSCSFSLNQCWDDINGQNLPNMVENYMDYSTENCQNSFTLGQVAMMRLTLTTYRSGLNNHFASVENENMEVNVQLYPNPTTGLYTLKFEHLQPEIKLVLTTMEGKIVMSNTYRNTIEIQEDLNVDKGVYLLNIYSAEGGQAIKKIIKSE
ncbi:Por secretion system C-terminal sorting domain-containing protein [Lishizhenia tianjinensis]|uniref:Por secretion system C-terminal sorting domain-containing protein n=1 Tax=Lishizhenia tianjinensis TaxID=477690 RepID=A0A1I6Y313_9FLAO|nr:zinc-dependent metalloprotease [Lishizhenia tianjinensis]SFT44474.1 Por secretion system C-terminal sorting domain-containing protein [Lishizhenia tianjinensis]